MNPSLIKKPAAYLPIAMSLTALALVLLHAARYGIIHEADEGPTAHLFPSWRRSSRWLRSSRANGFRKPRTNPARAGPANRRGPRRFCFRLLAYLSSHPDTRAPPSWLRLRGV